jgi:hypothetical protein
MLIIKEEFGFHYKVSENEYKYIILGIMFGFDRIYTQMLFEEWEKNNVERLE